MILTTTDRYIHFLSRGWAGKAHDYKQLKGEFPPDQSWFKGLTIGVDLGYLGIVKEYDCERVSIPKKKPKQGELTAAEKADNQQKSAERIGVEHAIGGLKRFRYLSDRLRTHKVSLYESAIGVCAGLWNFYLTN